MARCSDQPRGACRKKLTDLGREWARGGQGKRYQAAADAWGIDVLEDTADVLLWPQHIEAFRIFTACETQWRMLVGMGGAVFQGLDYAAVVAVMGVHNVESRDECLSQIQSLELGALAVLNSK